MKKAFVFLVCTILLFACAPTPAPAPIIPATNVPTDTLTFTPTVPTPTYTNTPTLVGLKTATNTPDYTPTVAETPIFLITPDTATPSVEMKGFISVAVSEKEFYKLAGCGPVSVKFAAQVGDPIGTAFVVLSVRFKSKLTGATSDWTNITMQTLGAGTFTHDLLPDEMKGLDGFKNAWVQYQFVATNSKTVRIGRTAVFNEKLTLLECELTPTPTLIPTPTVLKP